MSRLMLGDEGHSIKYRSKINLVSLLEGTSSLRNVVAPLSLVKALIYLKRNK